MAKKTASIYGIGVLKKGNKYTPLTAYAPYRATPPTHSVKYVNRALVARAKAGQVAHPSRKAARIAYKNADSIARKGGYKYGGTRQTQYGRAVVYKPMRQRRTRRNYRGQFAGSY